MRTRRSLLLWVLLTMAGCAPRATEAAEQDDSTVTSPDGRVQATFELTPEGSPHYDIAVAGEAVLRQSRLGLVRDDADFTTGLRLRSASPVTAVEDRYETLTAKRRQNVYRANQRVFHLETAAGKPLDVEFRVSNDGVAFRYVFPEQSAEVRQILDEVTSFHLLPESRAWLQPMQQPRTGFGRSNPAYEEYYQRDIPAGTPSTMRAGWVYPALFRSGETWLLVSETGLDRNYAGTRLRHESPGGEYTVGLPDPREMRDAGPVNPTSTLPWSTPWRLVVVGSLQTVAESMLGIDLAIPARVEPAGEIVPGGASWSWPLLGDGHTVYETQKEFVDYAARMGWRYCLVDALWDVQIGYDRIRELVDYAATRNVRILVWYNSAGSWNETPQTPRDRMLTHESRIAEFQRLKELGVAGVKIDFFGADGQDMIEYYHDIMIDAAPFGLLLNFHGATLPRGWSRTYPHLMTVEAIKGLEFATFGQENADQVPAHVTMIPFTRNVFDPIDFTPVVLDRYPRTQRRTTAAAELAQAILFTSGIQHYAEIPAGMAKAPEYAREFLRAVPTIWDDVRFLAGFPGEYVVFARRSGEQWFIAGVNGEDRERTVNLDLGFLPGGTSLSLITDGEDALGLAHRQVPVPANRQLQLTLQPRGGFVAR